VGKVRKLLLGTGEKLQGPGEDLSWSHPAVAMSLSHYTSLSSMKHPAHTQDPKATCAWSLSLLLTMSTQALCRAGPVHAKRRDNRGKQEDPGVNSQIDGSNTTHHPLQTTWYH
jgi:hypothetical protein